MAIVLVAFAVVNYTDTNSLREKGLMLSRQFQKDVIHHSREDAGAGTQGKYVGERPVLRSAESLDP